MNIFILGAVGLCLGSFVNALVWRLSQQLDSEGEPKKLSKKTKADLSIAKGRSMCPNCKHTLAWYDLVPVFSWLSLGGKCRYCKKPISWQYPLVELLTSALFVISYVAWPLAFGEAWVTVCFITWLVSLVGLVALTVYDIRYMLLPNRIVYPLIYITAGSLVLQFMLGRPIQDIWSILGAIAVAAGIFWVLYQVSGGTWIGGGDSKLGVLAGLLLASPIQAFLFLFVASLLGLLYTMPLLLTKRLTRASRVPFGPFLIAALIVVVLWGAKITTWYTNTFMTY
jgi:prepilin signal peptidase PulO-like enzyme (type II secretory pathway)